MMTCMTYAQALYLDGWCIAASMIAAGFSAEAVQAYGHWMASVASGRMTTEVARGFNEAVASGRGL